MPEWEKRQPKDTVLQGYRPVAACRTSMGERSRELGTRLKKQCTFLTMAAHSWEEKTDSFYSCLYSVTSSSQTPHPFVLL